MIYITGDTHNTLDMSNLSTKVIKKNCRLQNVDFNEITHAIILGDFGLPWYDCPIDEKGIHPTNKEDAYLLDWYNKKPFKILSLMGNHDNYTMLDRLPEVEMFGDKVLKVSENIFYLIRGHFYTIEDKSFLALGGAQSHDKEFRTPGIDYWPQEEWCDEEKKACLERVNLQGSKVDYIISHTDTSKGLSCFENEYRNMDFLDSAKRDSTVIFNDIIDSKVNYKKWFFGHWHTDWGYENYSESKYVPLYKKGICI